MHQHLPEPVRQPRESAGQVKSNLLRVDHSSWASLDGVDLEDLFSMLKSCLHFFRSRLRHSFRAALEERCRAALEGDVVAEARAWKLFAVVPIMLLSRPRGIGRICRDELASSADQCARGDWRELIDLAVQNVSTYTNSKREDSSEVERRGLAAQLRNFGDSEKTITGSIEANSPGGDGPRT